MTSVSTLDWKIAPCSSQLLAQLLGVDEVAVVRDRQAAAAVLDDERLRVLQQRLARGRVAVVADRRRAFELADDVLVEDVGHQPQAAVRNEEVVLRRDDAGGFLAAMLQREQTEIGEVGGLRMPEDADDAALLVKAIRHRRLLLPARLQSLASLRRRWQAALARTSVAAALRTDRQSDRAD